MILPLLLSLVAPVAEAPPAYSGRDSQVRVTVPRLEDQVKGFERPSFIQMDEPDHGERRKAVSPVVAPGNLARMEGMIRERTTRVLDELPRVGGE
jgi:cytochrome P450